MFSGSMNKNNYILENMLTFACVCVCAILTAVDREICLLESAIYFLICMCGWLFMLHKTLYCDKYAFVSLLRTQYCKFL